MFGFSLVGLDVKDAGLENVKEPEGGPVVARSKCYAVIAQAFDAPDGERFDRIRAGSFAKELAEAAAELPYGLDISMAEPSEASSDDFQAEYLRLFDVGAGGPPCPLYGGVWCGGDRMKVMEEVVRFYNYFGLKTSEERRIPPDHLSTELEFMHYLTYREAASTMPQLAAPYRRAQLDFLERQLEPWVPKLAEKVRELDASPFFSSLLGLAARMLETDHEHLNEQAGAPAAAST